MKIDIDKLSDLEKLELINLLWESIDNKDDILPVDDEHTEIILEREKTESPSMEWNIAWSKSGQL